MKKHNKTYQPKAGFNVPTGYFENFRVAFSETKTKTEKSNVSGFTVPTDYFNDFNVSLPEKETKVMPLFAKQVFIKVASIAAIAVLVFSIARTYKTSKSISYDNLDKTSIEAYIDNHDIDFSTLDFAYYFNDNSQSIKDELEKIDNESILNYLTESTEDISFLNE